MRSPLAAPHADDVAPEAPAAPLASVAERNLSVALSLRATAWDLMAAGLRAFRPDWTESEIQAEVRRRFLAADG